jgi:Sap, sulfolipid-1-addressing protein
MSSTPPATVGTQLQLLLLALDAALYPTLLAAVVILLNQPRRVALLSAYLAGGLIVSIGAGLLIVFVLKGAFHGSNRGLSATIDVAVGGLALLLAVALATRADARFAERRRGKSSEAADPSAQKAEPVMQRILARESSPLVFLAALVMNLPSAAYLVALKDITAAHHQTGTTIVLIIAFNLIMFLLAEVPLVGLIVNPQRTEQAVLDLNRWFSKNGRRIAIVLCVVLGAFLMIRGIANA